LVLVRQTLRQRSSESTCSVSGSPRPDHPGCGLQAGGSTPELGEVQHTTLQGAFAKVPLDKVEMGPGATIFSLHSSMKTLWMNFFMKMCRLKTYVVKQNNTLVRKTKA
jgi:hypothetical protein